MSLDHALASLRSYDCELRNGLTNHAPMVAEALHHMGLDAHIQAWVDAEIPRCRPRPAAQNTVDDDTWRTALGDPRRFTDWTQLFERSIGEHHWRATVRTWVPRLLPAFASAAAHGVIRVGHAVRALGETDSPARQQELADALASWACTYATLPVSPGPDRQLSPSAALAALAPLHLEEQQQAGSITAALEMLQQDAEFAAHFHTLASDDELEQLTLDIAATFARLFCRAAQSPLQAIVFTHAVTGVAAAQRIAPFLDPEQQQLLLRHAFHTGCALYRVYADQRYEPPVDEPYTPGLEESVYDALEHGDEHVIKLTDAGVTFTRLTADAFFLTAAEKCRRLLPPRRL